MHDARRPSPPAICRCLDPLFFFAWRSFPDAVVISEQRLTGFTSWAALQLCGPGGSEPLLVARRHVSLRLVLLLVRTFLFPVKDEKSRTGLLDGVGARQPPVGPAARAAARPLKMGNNIVGGWSMRRKFSFFWGGEDRGGPAQGLRGSCPRVRKVASLARGPTVGGEGGSIGWHLCVSLDIVILSL
ncbi:unnamed protein product [Ostreobium quekettii]|uniref:Uncharacterized protein n=1 Tax=Ostreobium quekettii TaxID=121088 RepID=A0A8S1JCV7_9CHLO|nr:unnamed protein product [Ostreobium quekettii]